MPRVKRPWHYSPRLCGRYGSLWRARRLVDWLVGAHQVVGVDGLLDTAEPVVCGCGPEGVWVALGFGEVEVGLCCGPGAQGVDDDLDVCSDSCRGVVGRGDADGV